MTPAKKAPAGPQTYVVQAWRANGTDTNEWIDIATVTVPPRTKRKTIIEKALADPDHEVALPATLRVLDATAAESIPVSVKERDPELVIG